MAKLVWDDAGKRLYETGTSKGVLYVQNTADGTYPTGVAWNGLSGVTESPSGAERTKIYADDMMYLGIRAVEEYGGAIEAYAYPPEFAACNGEDTLVLGAVIGQQSRVPFGFCYRTAIGNDLLGNDYGYKLHIVYGATVNPSEKAYQSVNESPEPMALSWEFETTPVAVTGKKPTATITIDSTKANAAKLAALELILYGDTSTTPRLPLPSEILTLLTPA